MECAVEAKTERLEVRYIPLDFPQFVDQKLIPALQHQSSCELQAQARTAAHPPALDRESVLVSFSLFVSFNESQNTLRKGHNPCQSPGSRMIRLQSSNVIT